MCKCYHALRFTYNSRSLIIVAQLYVHPIAYIAQRWVCISYTMMYSLKFFLSSSSSQPFLSGVYPSVPCHCTPPKPSPTLAFFAFQCKETQPDTLHSDANIYFRTRRDLDVLIIYQIAPEVTLSIDLYTLGTVT